MPLRTLVKERVNRKFLLFCLVLIITVTLIFTIRWAARNSLLSLNNSTAYSELYFAKPDGLPTRLTHDQVTSVPVTVANHQGKYMNYSYEVAVYENGTRTSLSEKQLKLSDGQKQTVPLPITATTTNQKVLVIITIINTNQRIQFYAKS